VGADAVARHAACPLLPAYHSLSIRLPDSEPAARTVRLCRWRRDFSERDRLILNLLRPHLVQAHLDILALEAARQTDRADLCQANPRHPKAGGGVRAEGASAVLHPRARPGALQPPTPRPGLLTHCQTTSLWNCCWREPRAIWADRWGYEGIGKGTAEV
jgi:hypothetical protein